MGCLVVCAVCVVAGGAGGYLVGAKVQKAAQAALQKAADAAKKL